VVKGPVSNGKVINTAKEFEASFPPEPSARGLLKENAELQEKLEALTAERNALNAALAAERLSLAGLRKEYGARKNETFEAFVCRLATSCNRCTEQDRIENLEKALKMTVTVLEQVAAWGAASEVGHTQAGKWLDVLSVVRNRVGKPGEPGE
jgi:hypothetical protein